MKTLVLLTFILAACGTNKPTATSDVDQASTNSHIPSVSQELLDRYVGAFLKQRISALTSSTKRFHSQWSRAAEEGFNLRARYQRECDGGGTASQIQACINLGNQLISAISQINETYDRYQKDLALLQARVEEANGIIATGQQRDLDNARIRTINQKIGNKSTQISGLTSSNARLTSQWNNQCRNFSIGTSLEQVLETCDNLSSSFNNNNSRINRLNKEIADCQGRSNAIINGTESSYPRNKCPI